MNTTTLALPLFGLRSALLEKGFELAYPAYAALTRRPIRRWQTSREKMLQYSAGSLGRTLGVFLHQYGFNPMPGFENHDVFHVLLGYGPSATEEASMQWCLIGNGKRSAFAWLAALAGAALFPEHWGNFHAAYLRGRRMRRFHHWQFEYLLQENLLEMRHFIQPTRQTYKRSGSDQCW
ncbi:MAG: hypothetical protein R2795_21100 [Saprospiraceae bacterium]